MCIVTGPNIDIATKLIKRLKGIFDTKLGLTFNDKETHLQLNGCIGYKAASLKLNKKPNKTITLNKIKSINSTETNED